MIRIDAKATATDNTVGSCKAFLIRRDKDDEFSLPVGDPDMRKEPRGLSDLALCLFNPDGSLDKFIRRISGTSPEEQLENIVFERAKHTLRAVYAFTGTRAWGEELDTGDIIFFEEINVDKAFQRQGLGMRMVAQILEIARTKTPDATDVFGIVWPGLVYRTVEEAVNDAGEGAEWKAIYKQLAATTLKFWRALGFRRIGCSRWLAFAEAPDHPSKHIDDSHGKPHLSPSSFLTLRPAGSEFR